MCAATPFENRNNRFVPRSIFDRPMIINRRKADDDDDDGATDASSAVEFRENRQQQEVHVYRVYYVYAFNIVLYGAHGKRLKVFYLLSIINETVHRGNNYICANGTVITVNIHVRL